MNLYPFGSNLQPNYDGDSLVDHILPSIDYQKAFVKIVSLAFCFLATYYLSIIILRNPHAKTKNRLRMELMKAQVESINPPIPFIGTQMKFMKSKDYFVNSEAVKTKFKNMSIAQRLEENAGYAAEQQTNEKPKGFAIVDNTPVPDAFLRCVSQPNQSKIEMEIPIHGEEQEIGGRKVGIASCQGMRPEMQDADIAQHLSFKVKGVEHAFEIFGIFDGHGKGGGRAAAFVKARLPQYLKNALESHNLEMLTEEGIFKAFEVCCQQLNHDYEDVGGTTATIAVLLNGQIWVVNVGDSRTILVNPEGKTIQASEDAKPNIPRYQETIERLGGFIEFGRVNGCLAPARAIGDKEIKGATGMQCVSPNPENTRFFLEDFKGGYLVLACDGLYDVATTNEVGQAITQMAESGESVETMSKRLVCQAIMNDSSDNVSVVVIQL